MRGGYTRVENYDPLLKGRRIESYDPPNGCSGSKQHSTQGVANRSKEIAIVVMDAFITMTVTVVVTSIITRIIKII